MNISNNMINYSNAYIEIELAVSIDYDDSDTAAKDSIPKLISLRNSFEIVKSLRIMLNNTIFSNENDINRSNLINYILNIDKFYSISHRNLNKASGTLSITNNQFITNKNYSKDESEKHEITFKIPIYLKDISNFFKNIGLIDFGEFNINLSLIDNILSTARTYTYEIKNAYLIVEEIQLSNEDNIKYLKMLNNGYEKKINFMENHVKIFNEKMNGVDENFHINNVSKSDSVLYMVLTAIEKKDYSMIYQVSNFQIHQLISIMLDLKTQFQMTFLPLNFFKNKSNHSNNFLISYNEFKTYYRIYGFNTNRETNSDSSNRYMNIITNINIKEIATPTIYIIWRNYTTITMNYSKNGLVVYKSYQYILKYMIEIGYNLNIKDINKIKKYKEVIG